MPKTGVGVTVIRKEACDKVTGDAKYTDDFISVGVLTAKTVTSTCSHARIRSIDTTGAAALAGVRAILTGESFPVLCGPLLKDRPPLAAGMVRYYGEPVALVVADSDFIASQAVFLIKVEYEPLPVVNSLPKPSGRGPRFCTKTWAPIRPPCRTCIRSREPISATASKSEREISKRGLPKARSS